MAFEFEVNGGEDTIHYVLSAQGIGRARGYRRRQIPWESIRTVWILPNSLLLFYSDTRYVILPHDHMTPEAKDYVMKQIHELGVRIKHLS